MTGIGDLLGWKFEYFSMRTIVFHNARILSEVKK